MTVPPVTIVTPSYNQGGFIRATIESVLSQDCPNLEYIVMDGGSTDETASVVAEYSGRLTWISERDRGQAHAINKGFAMARSPIVAWLNSDDMLLPGAVTRAVAAFAEAPHAGAVYAEGYLMDREGRRTGRFPATEPFNLWKLVHVSDYVLQQSTFFRRAAVESVGWLDETLHYALDWDLLIKLGGKFGLHYVPDYLGVLREYPDAKTFSGGAARVEEIRRVLERHTGLKRAPGYWVYALDHLQRAWKARLVDRAPPPLRLAGRLAHMVVHLPAAITVMLILRHAQGLSPDGWVSDELKWMLPKGQGEVVVRGTSPDVPDGLVLSATARGQELGRWRLNGGEFAVRFLAPPHAGPFAFVLSTSWYRRPRLGRAIGRRRLTWRLGSITWAHPTPGAVGAPWCPSSDASLEQ